MLRFASTKAAYDRFRRPIEYPRVVVLRELTATYTKIYARISADPQARATVSTCRRRYVPPRWVPPQPLFGLR
jgi:hypothetical protein